jgi:hypothetical protein
VQPIFPLLVSRLRMGLLIAGGLFACLSHAQTSAWSDGFSLDLKPDDRLTLMYSPFTHHFSPSDEHRYVWLVGLERERADGRLSGITYFSNSFGQPSAYVFP